MTFLLIGGSGYLGGRLTQYLRGQGHHVLITTRTAGPAISTGVLPWPAAVPPEDIDCIVHLASPDQRAAAADPVGFLATSAELAWSACAFASRLRPMPVLLYLSTFHVYGNACNGILTEETVPRPSHPYALGKWMGEEIVQLFRRRDRLPAVCLRLSNAFGAPVSAAISQWNLVFNDLCRQAVTGGKLEVRAAGEQRNFITLTDAVRAIEFIASTPGCRPSDGILHVGSSLNLSILQVAEMVAERARASLKIEVTVTSPPPSQENAKSFAFSTERLRSYGFAWTGTAADEIDSTLHISAEAFGS